MVDPLQGAMMASGAAMRAQSIRIRVASENLANAETTSERPGGTPYTRKTVVFANELSRAAGVDLVSVRRIARDDAPYRIVRAPGHPAADAKGDVKLPNVQPLIEMADIREANRSYEASLQAFKQTRDLLNMTIDLLKS